MRSTEFKKRIAGMSGTSVDQFASIDQEKVRNEVARAHFLKDARDAIVQSGAVMENGHFRHELGLSTLHGRRWVDPMDFLSNPSLSWRIMQGVLRMIPAQILDKVEVVAGPQSGGAYLAKELAGLITGQDPKRRIIEFCQIDVNRGKEKKYDDYSVRPKAQKRIRGKKVILIEDVVATGNTLIASRLALQNTELLGVFVVVNQAHQVSLDKLKAPVFEVLRFEPEELYRRDVCPMCKEGISLANF